MPRLKCKICEKEFYVKPSHQLLGYGKYCSRQCSGIGSKKGKMVSCDTCGKEIWKTPRGLTKSKSKKYFCTKACQTVWRNKFFSGDKHPLWNGGMATYRLAAVRFKITPECKICGNKDKRILAVHHLDRNRKNNVKENLIYLCHNCHHLVHVHSMEIK